MSKYEPAIDVASAVGAEGASSSSSAGRDVVAKAAMNDAILPRSLMEGEFQASYPGPDFAAYMRVLGQLSDAGTVEGGPQGAVATFEDRTIRIRFGPASGHR